MKSGIYQIRNLINGKVYVGSAKEFVARWREHRYELMTLCNHHSLHLQRSWDKYGEDNFFFGILQECEIEDLLFYEQLWMDCFRSYDPRFGYNICKVAGSSLGVKHSEEAKKKMSEAHLGKKLSEETRKRMSKARLGHFVSEETRKKLSQANLGKGLGRKHSEEAKKKISAAGLGREFSEERREKISKSKRGEKNPHATLTWNEAREIREKYISGKYTQRELSEEYGVARSNISSIVTNKNWRDENYQQEGEL